MHSMTQRMTQSEADIEQKQHNQKCTRPACLHACKLCNYEGPFALSQQGNPEMRLAVRNLHPLQAERSAASSLWAKSLWADPEHAPRHMEFDSANVALLCRAGNYAYNTT